jgi:hypothetical protein
MGTRGEQNVMQRNISTLGGALPLSRVLIGVMGAVALCALLIASSAAAKTVYPYEYAGFFDGTGSSKGQFKSQLAGIDYWPAGQNLMVSVSGEPGIIAKFTKTGTPAKFTALNNGAGRDYIDLGSSTTGEVAVDKSTSPDSGGNVYVQSYGFSSNGLPLPEFKNEAFGGCGYADGPNGEFFTFTNGNGQAELHELDPPTFKQTHVYLTEETFSDPEMCNMRIDGQRNFYGFWLDAGGGAFEPPWAIKLPANPIANKSGGTATRLPEQEFRYRLNWSCCGKTPEYQEGFPLHLGVDRSNDDVYLAETINTGNFEDDAVSVYDKNGGLLTKFGMAEGSYEGLRNVGGVAVDPVTHDVFVTNNRVYAGETRHVDRFVRGAPVVVPTTDTEQSTQPTTPGQATLHGVLNPDGVATTECYFEYGETPGLGTKAPCTEGNVQNGSADIDVTAPAEGLNKGTKYWVKLFAKNANGVSDGGPEQFIAQSKPIDNPVFADNVNTDGVRLNATVDPNGGRTWYYWEYGPTEAYGSQTVEKRLRRETSTETELPTSLVQPFSVSDLVVGLQSDTEYHFRLVTRNEQGTSTSPDQFIVTYAPEQEPACPNQLDRQQTGSQFLPDCRAYELASTSYSGGADVLSTTVPGKDPLVAYPDASGKLLYSLDSSIVPGVPGDPTNLGADPYVAVRGTSGWSTSYVGLPSGGMADQGLFGSPLYEASADLGEFAFGGPDICHPCFGDGSTNVPLRRDGALEKGMAGSLNPAADPAGDVRKRFSADGSTFVFGADKRFEASGNEGSVSIYARDLGTGATQVVSTMPNGSTMTGGGIAELGISSDGSRVLVGKQVGVDAAGNKSYDLYMHVAGSANSIEVVDSASGVIFNGMNRDGSKVFFTTSDQLAGDTDTSSDLFVADVTGTSTITRLSTGSGSGNSDACAPAGNWNVVSGGPNCSVVGIAGGGGVAEDEGTVFFLSPELLDGATNSGEPDNQPTANQPNLYSVKPGDAPEFVATIDSGPPIKHPAVVNGRDNTETHSYGDFQVTPNGRYAVFSSVLPLTGYETMGHSQLYRYDSVEDLVECVSCNPTNQPGQADNALSSHGLNLTDDGRVFFTTLETFALRDTNAKQDVYQWTEGDTKLVSSGLGRDDSALLSVSADGKDAFFFTRDILSRLDGNGNAIKVYDAREDGGFLVENTPQPCAAADECRGAGTQQPGPPPINTATGEGARRPVSKDCAALSRKAKKKNQQAKQLRHQAAKASSSKQASKLRKRADRLASEASDLNQQASACKSSSGGAAK